MRIRLLAFSLSVLAGLKFMALYKGNVFAATETGLGPTSAGTSQLALDVLELVQVSNVVDFSLDNGSGSNQYVPGGGDMSATSVICIYYNNATGVSLNMDSANGAGSYVLDDGSTNTISYSVDVDEGNDGTFATHAEGDTVIYPNMADNQLNCAGGTFNAIRVSVADVGFLNVPNGRYTDMLSYTISPSP